MASTSAKETGNPASTSVTSSSMISSLTQSSADLASTVTKAVTSVTTSPTNNLTTAAQLLSTYETTSRSIFATVTRAAPSSSRMVSTIISPSVTVFTVPSPLPSVCTVNVAPTYLLEVAAGPIPLTKALSKYNGDVTSIVATLNQLLPASLNQLNAAQVTSSLFSVVEPIQPGGNPTTFLGADFTDGSNAVVVLITSSQYKFNGLPGPLDIQTYGIVLFLLRLLRFQVEELVLVYTEHMVLASISFSVTATRKRDNSDVGFVVINGHKNDNFSGWNYSFRILDYVEPTLVLIKAESIDK
ncbi:hypothetical protein BCR33DRAFT_744013 [Rhizoclosmatium globosum]|uniref:Uncharacterized protein n=1 Tax=Rhizoclosmatium globosum TaxID=329046 RepID=A0A1Y2BD73_9FUNG|nr:hypothetical protein BCR33DRAFT_744013 [Rhizoclosmatium globosum]|eukprot:ORY32724.1 hypothetical protein BCR33DRAFT_744013 [Rhizoclosmatium globosum]